MLLKSKFWTLEQLKEDDPRHFLDLIFLRVIGGNTQVIKYGSDNVYVISEEEYQKLLSLGKDDFSPDTQT